MEELVSFADSPVPSYCHTNIMFTQDVTTAEKEPRNEAAYIHAI